MTIRSLLVPVVAIAATLGLAQPAAADALQKIHFTIPVATIIMFPLFQAQDKGFSPRRTWTSTSSCLSWLRTMDVGDPPISMQMRRAIW